MKKIITLLAFALFTIGAYAQAPQKMSYQAVIRNAASTLVTNQLVGMQISVLQGTSTGPAVYVETQTATTNANGLVSLEIGNGTVVSGTFASIDWSTGSYFIKTETDPTGGTSYTINGTSQLLSVPYALYSGSAGGSLPNGAAAGNTPYWNGTTWVTNSSNIFNNGGNVGIGTSTPDAPLTFPGTVEKKIHLYGSQPNGYVIGVENTELRIATGTAGTDKITFRTGGYTGTERMQIAGDGNVGIGTATPSAKLDIAGTVKIADGTQGAGKVLTSDAAGLASWVTPAAGALYYNRIFTNAAPASSFPVGPNGSTMTFNVRYDCTTAIAAGGTMYVNSTDGNVTLLGVASNTGSITASANVISLTTACGVRTITFTPSGGSIIMTTNGPALMDMKMTVLTN